MESSDIEVARPAWPPAGRRFSREFTEVHEVMLEWVAGRPAEQHLLRTRDWVQHLDPDVSEPVLIAALVHDAERFEPGGPELDFVNDAWDDAVYIEAHSQRSAAVVAAKLRRHGSSPRFEQGVRDPILQHEFGGTRDGNLMQAADSLSWLEAHVDQAAGWATSGRCGVEKARQKLTWMRDRVRHPRGREIAFALYEPALVEFDGLVAAPASGRREQ